MNKCIYTLKDDQLCDSEHIIPAFIGGMKCLPLGYVSKEANHSLSKLENEASLIPNIAIPRSFYGPGMRGTVKLKVPGIYNIIIRYIYRICYLFKKIVKVIEIYYESKDDNRLTIEEQNKYNKNRRWVIEAINSGDKNRINECMNIFGVEISVLKHLNK